jgi:hypothetical protein
MRLTIKTSKGILRFEVPTMKELVELIDKYKKGELLKNKALMFEEELKKEVRHYETS